MPHNREQCHYLNGVLKNSFGKIYGYAVKKSEHINSNKTGKQEYSSQMSSINNATYKSFF